MPIHIRNFVASPKGSVGFQLSLLCSGAGRRARPFFRNSGARAEIHWFRPRTSRALQPTWRRRLNSMSFASCRRKPKPWAGCTNRTSLLSTKKRAGVNYQYTGRSRVALQRQCRRNTAGDIFWKMVPAARLAPVVEAEASAAGTTTTTKTRAAGAAAAHTWNAWFLRCKWSAARPSTTCVCELCC